MRRFYELRFWVEDSGSKRPPAFEFQSTSDHDAIEQAVAKCGVTDYAFAALYRYGYGGFKRVEFDDAAAKKEIV